MSNFYSMGRLKTKFEQVTVIDEGTVIRVWIPSLKQWFPVEEVEFEESETLDELIEEHSQIISPK